ncbi:MAG: cell division protein ZapA [Butyrivibrio sp.]|nr:cell division protein ZapA [Butyrivibrio sp.]
MASNKTDVEVIIGGRVFTLSGSEDEEYLQRVASYLNGKLAEFAKVEGMKRQPVDVQNVLMQINIADDYFKAKEEIDRLEGQLSDKEKELYDIKHELIATQIKLENTEKNMKTLQETVNNDSLKMIQMETELKSLRK